jgi:hypothetical protein
MMCRKRSDDCSLDGRRGVAVVTAVVLMGLIAALLAVMSTHIASQLKRSRCAAAKAQLDELLLAAEPTARTLLEEGAPASIDVQLPASVSGRCTCTREPGERILVEAKLGAPTAVTASQRLTYRQTGGRWELVAADLSPAD